jgi:hypothetical protein
MLALPKLASAPNQANLPGAREFDLACASFLRRDISRSLALPRAGLAVAVGERRYRVPQQLTGGIGSIHFGLSIQNTGT